MTTEEYVLRGGWPGRERLRILSDVFGQSTISLLARAGIPAGSKCLDVGCGGGDVTIELARAAGLGGEAIGIDRDETVINIARQERDQLGIDNVHFEVQDVIDWEPGDLFDVAYSRFFLTHLPDPERVLSAVSRHIRPGGIMIVEDLDFWGHFSEPDCPALHRFVEFYNRTVEARGADPHIGPRLPAMLRNAGFEDLQVTLFHPVDLEGGIKLLTCITLEAIADAVLNDGFASEEEFRHTVDELYRFAENPQTLMGGPRLFQVWGRRSED